jgi:hypothetical protein
VLRDFKHMNPHGDEEAQELQTTNVSVVDFLRSFLLILSILWTGKPLCPSSM